MRCSIGLGVAGSMALAVLATSAAAKAEASDPARGKELAEGRCAACHHVASGTRSSPKPEAPNFLTIANRADQSADKLIWTLVFPPHPEMPDVPFSNNELRDISAYILSLRDQK